MDSKRRQLVRRNATKAFKALGPRNPLKELHEPERDFLYSTLELFATLISSPDGTHAFASIEDARRTAFEAGLLSSKLQEVFKGPDSDLFRPFLLEFSQLPTQLAKFSEVLKEVSDLIGKPGHKDQNFNNVWLIVASEFVRLSTGQPFDEHLAELYQAIAGERSLTDLSGDAIRKKRVYLARNYRALSCWAQSLAARAFSSGLQQAIETSWETETQP